MLERPHASNEKQQQLEKLSGQIGNLGRQANDRINAMQASNILTPDLAGKARMDLAQLMRNAGSPDKKLRILAAYCSLLNAIEAKKTTQHLQEVNTLVNTLNGVAMVGLSPFLLLTGCTGVSVTNVEVPVVTLDYRPDASFNALLQKTGRKQMEVNTKMNTMDANIAIWGLMVPVISHQATIVTMTAGTPPAEMLVYEQTSNGVTYQINVDKAIADIARQNGYDILVHMNQTANVAVTNEASVAGRTGTYNAQRRSETVVSVRKTDGFHTQSAGGLSLLRGSRLRATVRR